MTAEQTASSASATEIQSETAHTEPKAMDELRIWVGDSRTLGMEQALDGATPDVFIGAAGEGYDWFAADGLPQLLSAMKAHPLSPIIFNLGVNDYDNLSRYLALYRSLQKSTLLPGFIFSRSIRSTLRGARILQMKKSLNLTHSCRSSRAICISTAIHGCARTASRQRTASIMKRMITAPFINM